MTVRQIIELLASPFNNTRSVLVFLALVGFSIAFSHHVYAADDAKRGQQIAKKWCATCHETSPGSARIDKNRPASSLSDWIYVIRKNIDSGRPRRGGLAGVSGGAGGAGVCSCMRAP